MRLRDRLWPGLRTVGVWNEVHVAVATGAVVALGTLTVESGPPTTLLLYCGAALLAATLLVLRRRAPLVPFGISAVLAAVAPALGVGLLTTAYAVGRYVRPWPLVTGAAGVGALAVLLPLELGTPGEWLSGLGSIGLLVVLPGAVGIWQRTRAELVAALRERAETAEAERELLAREAVLEERTRIAREMHDAVGHRVSLMVLQAGAIEMAAADSERVEQLAAHVQSAGRQALDELRQMVGVLRGADADEEAPLGPQPGLDGLPGLVEQARAAGMDVRLCGAADPGVDPVTGRAAYRIVQEGLTNAGRHAPGAVVTVSVARTADELAVRVVNGAPDGVPAGTPGGGYGLVGLGERVRTLGGRLTAEPRLDGGFCVEAVLPV